MSQTSLFVAEDGRVPLNHDHKAVFTRLRNYLAGRFVGATRDETLLREVAKCLYIKLFMERHPEEASRHGTDGDEGIVARGYHDLFGRIPSFYPNLFDPGEEIALDNESLCTVMGELSRVTLIDAERDAVGDAFEAFIGSHIRGASGQFFTPRNAVKLLVDAVEPSLSDRIIDPACGAGGFLSATVQYLIGRGASEESLRKHVSEHLYGIDKDAYLSQLARTHVGLLSGATPNIVCADSLAWDAMHPGSLDSFPVAGTYDVVLTNPPFGANIVAASDKVLGQYRLAHKWKKQVDSGSYAPTREFQRNVAPQVLFLERCVELLRPGGRLGIVVPESLISSPRHRYCVEYIRRECSLIMIAGMPENLFKTSGKGGTHTKVCLAVLEKRSVDRGSERRRVFMAEAQWCGHDSRGRSIPHDDLPKIAENLARSRIGAPNDPTILGFTIDEDEIRDGVLAPRQYEPTLEGELKTLADSHLLLRVGDLVDDGVLAITTGDEVGKLAYGTGDVPFVRTSDVSNWEIKADAKHRVSQEVYETLKARQDVRAGDVLMVRDGTYLIGTCALVTEQDTRIVYQSHIFKIRVHPNQYRLTPHLLIAVLSSAPVQRQIRAKRVTQDIIDSLGNRVMDLVLPIPRDEARRDRITALVEEAVRSRMVARDLAQRAVGSVLES